MPDLITVTGLQETVEMLAKAPKTVVALGYTQALSAGGNVIADGLEVNTPVKAEDTGGILDKGELRDSIVVAVNLDSQFRGGSVDVGFMTSNAADSVALWLDAGHRMVSHTGKVLGSVAGNGFMRKTADQTLEAAVDAFAASLRETVAANFPQNEVAA